MSKLTELLEDFDSGFLCFDQSVEKEFRKLLIKAYKAGEEAHSQALVKRVGKLESKFIAWDEEDEKNHTITPVIKRTDVVGLLLSAIKQVGK